MMSTAPPFFMSHDQASRLQAYLQTYRQHAFANILPTVERNNLLRLTQAIQGKLIHLQVSRTEALQLILSQEERAALKAMITELLYLYARQPERQERDKALTDLASLKMSLNTYCERRPTHGKEKMA